MEAERHPGGQKRSLPFLLSWSSIAVRAHDWRGASPIIINRKDNVGKLHRNTVAVGIGAGGEMITIRPAIAEAVGLHSSSIKTDHCYDIAQLSGLAVPRAICNATHMTDK